MHFFFFFWDQLIESHKSEIKIVQFVIVNPKSKSQVPIQSPKSQT